VLDCRCFGAFCCGTQSSVIPGLDGISWPGTSRACNHDESRGLAGFALKANVVNYLFTSPGIHRGRASVIDYLDLALPDK